MPMNRLLRPSGAALALTIALVAAACSAGTGASSPTPSAAPGSAAPSPVSSGRPSVPPIELPSGMPTGDGEIPPADIEDAAVAAAAEHAGVDPSEVHIVQASHVTWPDGSLGCPEPGSVYTQALVPGWWIILDAGGKTVDVRATDNGSAKVCEGFRPAGASG